MTAPPLNDDECPSSSSSSSSNASPGQPSLTVQQEAAIASVLAAVAGAKTAAGRPSHTILEAVAGAGRWKHFGPK